MRCYPKAKVDVIEMARPPGRHVCREIAEVYIRTYCDGGGLCFALDTNPPAQLPPPPYPPPLNTPPPSLIPLCDWFMTITDINVNMIEDGINTKMKGRQKNVFNDDDDDDDATVTTIIIIIIFKIIIALTVIYF